MYITLAQARHNIIRALDYSIDGDTDATRNNDTRR